MYIKNIKELKKNLRARYRRYREKMNVEQKIRLDASIQCRLLTLEEYTRADTTVSYTHLLSSSDKSCLCGMTCFLPNIARN